MGCNLKCPFCQNWTISQTGEDVGTFELTAERAVELAGGGDMRARGNIGLAFTYSEPLIWYEFVLDTARLARREGLASVLVTNGYIRQDPLADLSPWIDAANVDLKGFREGFYRRLGYASLEPVKDTIRHLFQRGCHLELTMLLIPGWNDDYEEIEAAARWIASLSEEIPLHLSRYFPRFKLDLPPTPVETLERAKAVAGKALRYVYVGNTDIPGGSTTLCPGCAVPLVTREGYRVRAGGLSEEGRCRKCGHRPAIIL